MELCWCRSGYPKHKTFFDYYHFLAHHRRIFEPSKMENAPFWCSVRVVEGHFTSVEQCMYSMNVLLFCSPFRIVVTTRTILVPANNSVPRREVAACGAILQVTSPRNGYCLNLLISIDVQPSHLIGTSKDGHRRSRTSKVTASPFHSPFREFCHICSLIHIYIFYFLSQMSHG